MYFTRLLEKYKEINKLSYENISCYEEIYIIYLMDYISLNNPILRSIFPHLDKSDKKLYIIFDDFTVDKIKSNDVISLMYKFCETELTPFVGKILLNKKISGSSNYESIELDLNNLNDHEILERLAKTIDDFNSSKSNTLKKIKKGLLKLEPIVKFLNYVFDFFKE